MKILRIADIPNTRTGGMSRAIYYTSDILASMGHDIDYLIKQDLQVIGSPSVRRRFTVPLQIPRLVHRLIQQGKHYDVIEIHEEIAAFYCFIRQIRKKLPPVVIFSHGLQERSRLAELAYRKQKGLPVPFTLQYLQLTTLQAIYSLRHCDHVICLNSEDNTYLQQVGLPKNYLTQVDNGVDTQFILAGNAIVEAEIVRTGILFIGSWILRKGILDLVPSINQVMQHYPSVHFTIAGFSLNSDTILSQFSENLRFRINLIPKLSTNEELIEIYRQHSILVLPSYFEGQPLTMLEAAAMGLAIVTTNVCGMADFIENGINGFTVSVGDVKSLTERIAHLVCNPILAFNLGKAARHKVQSYTWKSSAEKILRAYQQSIDNNLSQRIKRRFNGNY